MHQPHNIIFGLVINNGDILISILSVFFLFGLVCTSNLIIFSKIMVRFSLYFLPTNGFVVHFVFISLRSDKYRSGILPSHAWATMWATMCITLNLKMFTPFVCDSSFFLICQFASNKRCTAPPHHWKLNINLCMFC